MNETPKLGIKEQIQKAQSAKAIETLLARIRNYQRAHPSTVRKCERAATKRLAEIGINGKETK